MVSPAPPAPTGLCFIGRLAQCNERWMQQLKYETIFLLEPFLTNFGRCNTRYKITLLSVFSAIQDFQSLDTYIEKLNINVYSHLKQKTKRNYFFDFCPKDLKRSNEKIKMVNIKYPLVNMIKCLHFFDLTQFQRRRQKSENNFVCFFG